MSKPIGDPRRGQKGFSQGLRPAPEVGKSTGLSRLSEDREAVMWTVHDAGLCPASFECAGE
jgi:hypothetical protein